MTRVKRSSWEKQRQGFLQAYVHYGNVTQAAQAAREAGIYRDQHR